ncbi:MAG: GNAT family protein [Ignavibacteriota bacterium]
MFIQVGNIQIRDFHLTDVDALVKYANNYKISKFMRDSFPYPYTEENATGWINYIKKNNFNLSFALANDTELIGGIGALPQVDVHRFSAEVGFWIGEPFWNQGIISKTLHAFCSYLFSKYNFNRLTANVFEGNDASKRVLEKTGFILEGTQRKNVYKENKFFDHYIYGLLKEDFKYAR